MSHTPRPWNPITDNNGIEIDPTGFRIDESPLSAATKANAKLIAATPYMLEALENLVEKSDLILSEINSFDCGWYYQFQAAIQQARKALAKATGDHQANHEERAR